MLHSNSNNPAMPPPLYISAATTTTLALPSVPATPAGRPLPDDTILHAVRSNRHANRAMLSLLQAGAFLNNGEARPLQAGCCGKGSTSHKRSSMVNGPCKGWLANMQCPVTCLLYSTHTDIHVECDDALPPQGTAAVAAAVAEQSAQHLLFPPQFTPFSL